VNQCENDAVVAHPVLPTHYSTSSHNFLSTPPEDEAVLDRHVPAMRQLQLSPSSARRRSMFPSMRQSSSVPSFSVTGAATAAPATTSIASKKTLSLPHLLTKQPSASCLRESPRYSSSPSSSGTGQSHLVRRASSSESASSCSLSSSVRFDMTAVAVLHFEPPQERYAEEGWADYFQ
jgi:hypothetical protein